MAEAGPGAAGAVRLTCEAAAGAPAAVTDALCAALAAHLGAADPPWRVAQEDAAARMRLQLMAADAQGLQARLFWTMGAASGESPLMAFDVTDADLAPAMLARFVPVLLREAGWPG